MAQAELVVTFGFAWWLRPYLSALAFFCTLMDSEPDWAKVEAVVERALVRVIGAAS